MDNYNLASEMRGDDSCDDSGSVYFKNKSKRENSMNDKTTHGGETINNEVLKVNDKDNEMSISHTEGMTMLEPSVDDGIGTMRLKTREIMKESMEFPSRRKT